eukprot:scaffold882_cov154-Pinguiococcus_pyrenoidosus.AAC.2
MGDRSAVIDHRIDHMIDHGFQPDRSCRIVAGRMGSKYLTKSTNGMNRTISFPNQLQNFKCSL